METDYSKLTEITVKTQEELDRIPKDFTGTVYIEFGTIVSPAIVRDKFGYHVAAWGNSSVEAWENSSVEARGNSSVVARENSSVEAWENSSVEAWENSSVEAWENSFVEARGNSFVVARGNSFVVARGNSFVVAWENSSVEAWENSSVEAWENSSVEAWENSSVVARENSSVVAWGNVQIINCLFAGRGKIEISGNARIVYNPQNIHEYMDFYKLPHTKTYGTFYKAVHKVDGKYKSDLDSRFEYCIGGTVQSDTINTNTSEICGAGIHMAYLQLALDYGKTWGDLAILEVKAKLDDVIVPPNAGKVRVNKVEVIREVPLEECGLYGKILAKRRKNDE